MAYLQRRQTKGGATAYIVKWKAADGKHRTKGGFRTKKDAQAYAVEIEHSIRRGLEFDPKAGGIVFRDAAQLWLESRHDLKATTLAAYRDALAPSPEDGPLAKRHNRLADLRIDAVFGGYPINAIKRERISEWVQRLTGAGKRPSTIRNAYFLVRMVLGQAVVDGRLPANPADYVKLPSEHNSGGTPGVVDDPAQFLSAAQVSALVAATPWPYNVHVHVAAWAGLRAAELAGLQVGDVTLPDVSVNPNAAPKPGELRVERSATVIDGVVTYQPTKTRGSRRRVPLTAATTELLRDYLAEHPKAHVPSAPLFPSMMLVAPRPTGVAAPIQAVRDPLRGPTTDVTELPAPTTGKAVATRQATALADLSVSEAEARLQLDWDKPLRHMTFYKAVYRPAVLRANRLVPTARLSAELKFHSLRHTYASLCVAAGIPPLELSRFMGHNKVTTTLGIYTHLFEDDHADAMTALGAMEAEPDYGPNVVPLWG